MQAVRIVITGVVQGVFFRKYAFEQAINLGIDGFVTNVADGNVMIEATGDDQSIEELIQWCHRGSPNSVIEKVDVTEIPKREYQGFTIRY